MIGRKSAQSRIWLANLVVPNIAAPKFALIEPDFDAGGSQCVGDTSRRLGILRGIAQEYGSSRLVIEALLPRPWLGDPLEGVPPTSPANVSLPEFECPLSGLSNGCLGSIADVAVSQLGGSGATLREFATIASSLIWHVELRGAGTATALEVAQDQGNSYALTRVVTPDRTFSRLPRAARRDPLKYDSESLAANNPPPRGSHKLFAKQGDSIMNIRDANKVDAQMCGRILYDAFRDLAEQHNFPPDFPSPEVATGLASMLIGAPGFYGVVAEEAGKIVGSNFMDERSPIFGIGPISVAPEVQNHAVGQTPDGCRTR